MPSPAAAKRSPARAWACRSRTHARARSGERETRARSRACAATRAHERTPPRRRGRLHTVQASWWEGGGRTARRECVNGRGRRAGAGEQSRPGPSGAAPVQRVNDSTPHAQTRRPTPPHGTPLRSESLFLAALVNRKKITHVNSSHMIQTRWIQGSLTRRVDDTLGRTTPVATPIAVSVAGAAQLAHTQSACGCGRQIWRSEGVASKMLRHAHAHACPLCAACPCCTSRAVQQLGTHMAPTRHARWLSTREVGICAWLPRKARRTLRAVSSMLRARAEPKQHVAKDAVLMALRRDGVGDRRGNGKQQRGEVERYVRELERALEKQVDLDPVAVPPGFEHGDQGLHK